METQKQAAAFEAQRASQGPESFRIAPDDSAVDELQEGLKEMRKIRKEVRADKQSAERDRIEAGELAKEAKESEEKTGKYSQAAKESEEKTGENLKMQKKENKKSESSLKKLGSKLARLLKISERKSGKSASMSSSSAVVAKAHANRAEDAAREAVEMKKEANNPSLSNNSDKKAA